MLSTCPVLKTTINTNGPNRYHVKRELVVKTSGGTISDTSGTNSKKEQAKGTQHDAFKDISGHELAYQTLVANLSLSCFSRTYEVSNFVILEIDCDCQILADLLEKGTATQDDLLTPIKYLCGLQSKTCMRRSEKKLITQLQNTYKYEESKKSIKRTVFEAPILKALQLYSKEPTLTYLLSLDDLTSKINKLASAFYSAEKCVVHGNFVPENTLLKTCRGDRYTLAYGGELSHLGHPAYDVGTYISNLFIWYYIHMLNPDSKGGRAYSQMLEQYITECISFYMDDLGCPMTASEFIKLIAGFAGVYMLFRTVEDSWNTHLPIENIKPDVIGCALRLIDRYEIMGSANQLVTIALMLI